MAVPIQAAHDIREQGPGSRRLTAKHRSDLEGNPAFRGQDRVAFAPGKRITGSYEKAWKLTYRWQSSTSYPGLHAEADRQQLPDAGWLLRVGQ